MPEIFYKLAAEQRTITQMLSEPRFDDFPPQTPFGYSSESTPKLEEWHFPDKTGTVFFRAEERTRTLDNSLQLRGYARARWFFPFLPWSHLLYLQSTFFTTDDDVALVTIQMPGDFGSSAAMVTYYGNFLFPFPEDTMNKPGAGQRGGLGWYNVFFDFVKLRPSSV